MTSDCCRIYISVPSGIITAGYMDELKERQTPSKVEDVDNES